MSETSQIYRLEWHLASAHQCTWLFSYFFRKKSDFIAHHFVWNFRYFSTRSTNWTKDYAFSLQIPENLRWRQSPFSSFSRTQIKIANRHPQFRSKGGHKNLRVGGTHNWRPLALASLNGQREGSSLGMVAIMFWRRLFTGVWNYVENSLVCLEWANRNYNSEFGGGNGVIWFAFWQVYDLNSEFVVDENWLFCTFEVKLVKCT